MGGVVDTVGDVLGGAADFVGDVAGGVADFAGDVVQDFGPEIATAIALYYMGPAALTAEGAAAAGAAETFGSSTAAEILANQAASSAFNSGLGTIGSSFLPGAGGGYQGGFIKTGIEGLDTALNIAKSGYDVYNALNQSTPQALRPIPQQIPSLTYQQTSSGENVDPNAFSKGLQFISLSALPELGDITSIITKSVSGLGNILMNAFGTDNLSEVIKKYGPAVLSIIGGKLSYDDQKRINDIVMGAYNKYNVGTELKNLQYRTGQGLASLPVLKGGKPLGSQTVATAPQRTAADVVYRPKAQMGGIMSNGEEQPIYPRLEALNKNLGQAEQTLGQPSNQFDVSSITTAITGQQPQGFAEGGISSKMENLLDEYKKFKMMKDQGRMKYAMGSTQQPMQMQPINRTQGIGKSLVSNAMKDPRFMQILQQVKSGKIPMASGRPGYKYGSTPIRTNQAGITELDYRQKGGYVPPIGVKEKADDIPAMLSNNEFVFTADAVRAAGGGSVKEGAKKMYSLMRQLEGRS